MPSSSSRLVARGIAVVVTVGAVVLVAWALAEGSPNALGVVLFGAIVVVATGGSVGLWRSDPRIGVLGSVVLLVLATGQAALGPFLLALAALLGVGTLLVSREEAEEPSDPTS